MAWISYLQIGAIDLQQQAAEGLEEAALAAASCSSECITTVTLYHQTSPENAQKILSTGIFKPGTTGYGGAGIYFAPEVGATCCKATKKGVILECQVEVGRIREITRQGDWSGRFWRRLYCYDSIMITNLDDGVEYVVFDAARVKEVRLWRPGVEAAEMAAAVLAQHCAWFIQCVVFNALQSLRECCRSAVQQQGQQQQQYTAASSSSNFTPSDTNMQQKCM